MDNDIRMYFSTLFYVVIFTSVLLVATVVLHESGHYVTGRVLGCSNVEVVLLDESFSTYTSMNCPNLNEPAFYTLLLSSLVFILPLAFLMFRWYRLHALVIFGFNLVISSSDFSYFPQFLGYSFILFGAALVVYSETLLIDHRIKYTVKPVNNLDML